MTRLTRDTNCPQQPQDNQPDAVAMLMRLERRLKRLEQMLDEGLGGYLADRFPYGDGKTDRWGRRR